MTATSGVIAASFALYATAAWAMNGLHLADDQVMARTVEAWMALFGATPGLSHLTKTGPPLPILLQLPFAAVPGLAWPSWPAALVSCAMAVLLLGAIANGLEVMGVKPRLRLALLALCALQPALLLGTASGASGVTAAALATWALVLALHWSAGNSTPHLVGSAFVLGFACLASYWGLLLGAAILAVIFVVEREDTVRAGALMVAYAVPVAAIVMPWPALIALFSATAVNTSASPLPLALPSFGAGTYPGGLAALYMMVGSCGALLAPIVFQAARLKRRIDAMLCATSAALFVPPVVSLAATGHVRGEALLPGLAAGVLLLGCLVAQSPPRWIVPAAAILIGAAAVQMWAWDAGLGSATEQRLARVAASGSLATQETTAHAIGRYLGDQPEARDILIDDSRGYPIVYWSGGAGRYFTPADTLLFADMAGQPRRYLSFVLVSRGDAVDNAFNGLHANGARWAELEKEWPVGSAPGSGWRLYRVTKT